MSALEDFGRWVGEQRQLEEPMPNGVDNLIIRMSTWDGWFIHRRCSRDHDAYDGPSSSPSQSMRTCVGCTVWFTAGEEARYGRRETDTNTNANTIDSIEIETDQLR